MDVIRTQKLTGSGIEDLTFRVERGSRYGIVGRKGDGKTELLRMLSGLVPQQAGEVFLFGRKPEESELEMKTRVAYVPSDCDFDENLSVKDILDFTAGVYQKPVRKKQDKYLKLFDLEPGDRIRDLNAQERRCLSFICAFLVNPDLYLIDEPGKELEVTLQNHVYGILNQKMKKGATLLFTTESISEVQMLSDHVGILKKGKLFLEGQTEKLLPGNIRRVVIRGVSGLEKLEGMENYRENRGQESVSFLYFGDIRVLLQEMSLLPLTDIEISNPDLEEVLHYYFEERGGDV